MWLAAGTLRGSRAGDPISSPATPERFLRFPVPSRRDRTRLTRCSGYSHPSASRAPASDVDGRVVRDLAPHVPPRLLDPPQPVAASNTGARHSPTWSFCIDPTRRFTRAGCIEPGRRLPAALGPRTARRLLFASMGQQPVDDDRDTLHQASDADDRVSWADEAQSWIRDD